MSNNDPLWVVFTSLYFFFQFLGTLQVVSEPSFHTERLMGAPSIHVEKIKYDKYFLLLRKKFAGIKIFCVTGKILQHCSVYEHWGRK